MILFDQFIHVVSLPLMAAAVLLWIAAVVSWFKSRRNQGMIQSPVKTIPPVALKCMLAFAAIVFFFLMSSTIIVTSARNEVWPLLQGKISDITIEGGKNINTEKLASALAQIKMSPAHHSHVTTSFNLVLQTSAGPLTIVLGRDSQDPHEYWVFYPKYNITKLNEIGRVFSDALDI